jgi:hypothetical protein
MPAPQALSRARPQTASWVDRSFPPRILQGFNLEFTMSGNLAQLRLIQRYHAKLCRLGRASSLEASARQWINRFAARFRHHFRP